jgi:hypothetical protein
MPETLVIILILISGISWTVVYIEMIRRGFMDKTYGMPLFALALNIAWEFMFAFWVFGGVSVQRIVNITWFLLDALIVYTYFRYGRREFPKASQPFFVPWSLVAFAVGFLVIYFTHYEFDDFWGARYSAFAQNLLMSVLFINMLVHRDDVRGQSMYIAIFKWLGTLAPTIQHYLQTGSNLILILGIGCFVYDVIYIGMLYQKFVELGLNPLTRKPRPKA